MRAASLRTSSGDCVLQAIRADFASEVIDGLQHPLPCSRQDHRRFPPQNDNTGTCARTQPEGGGRPSRVVVLYGHTGTHHGTTGKTYFFPEVVTDRLTDCGKPRPRKAAEATTTNTASTLRPHNNYRYCNTSIGGLLPVLMVCSKTVNLPFLAPPLLLVICFLFW